MHTKYAETGAQRRCVPDGGKKRGRALTDITGQTFGQLTAIEPTEKRDARRSVIWRWRCVCGREIEASQNVVVHANKRSCGCRKETMNSRLPGFLTRVDGTCMERLRQKKASCSARTGEKGVYLIRGRYVAKVVLQGKQYYLGTFDTREEAAHVRRKADEAIRRDMLDHYAAWRARAAENPAWGEAHPVHYDVSKTGNGLEIEASPPLGEILSGRQDGTIMGDMADKGESA